MDCFFWLKIDGHKEKNPQLFVNMGQVFEMYFGKGGDFTLGCSPFSLFLFFRFSSSGGSGSGILESTSLGICITSWIYYYLYLFIYIYIYINTCIQIYTPRLFLPASFI